MGNSGNQKSTGSTGDEGQGENKDVNMQATVMCRHIASGTGCGLSAFKIKRKTWGRWGVTSILCKPPGSWVGLVEEAGDTRAAFALNSFCRGSSWGYRLRIHPTVNAALAVLSTSIEIYFTSHQNHPSKMYSLMASRIITDLHNHCHNLFLQHFLLPPNKAHAHWQSHPRSQQLWISLWSLWICPFCAFPINGIRQRAVICDQLLS